MSRKVSFISFIESPNVKIYSYTLDGNSVSEAERTLNEFSSITNKFLKEDLYRIITAIDKISENGALESYFRPEGKFKDNVCAIPLLIDKRKKRGKSGTLRLYCIRISAQLLIIGGGGIKTTSTYQEDEILNKCVSDLQAIDKKLALKSKKENINLEDGLDNIKINIQ
jgi:hypothetical protein